MKRRSNPDMPAASYPIQLDRTGTAPAVDERPRVGNETDRAKLARNGKSPPVTRSARTTSTIGGR